MIEHPFDFVKPVRTPSRGRTAPLANNPVRIRTMTSVACPRAVGCRAEVTNGKRLS
jgi:hypothetical protein